MVWDVGVVIWYLERGRNVWIAKAMMVCAGPGWKTRVAVVRARGLSIVCTFLHAC